MFISQHLKIDTIKLFGLFFGFFVYSLAMPNVAHAQVQKHEAKTRAVNSIKIKARDDKAFLLSADYYAGFKDAGGVIVLHDCKHDRKAYRGIAKTLAAQGLHTLLLDFRGYGESVAAGFSREAIKKSTKDIVAYQSAMALISTYWQEDLFAVYEYLRKQMANNKGIAIVASGCSSAAAVSLAEKVLLNSMVLITPKMSFADKERYKNLIDIPSYFITATYQLDSYQTANELFTWNGSSQSKIQIFKGDRYAYQLIAGKQHLVDDIGQWIKQTVN